MQDTAQPTPAAETEAVNPLAEAANAFKTYDTAAPREQPRGPDGKFVSNQPPVDDNAGDNQDDAVDPNAGDAADGTSNADDDGAADDDSAQLTAVDLPTSWPSEMAETWQNLPAETQDFIVKREAERDAAVNAKFQEAANVRKANEALITEANQSRQRFAEAADYVLNMVQPQRPPLSMLTPGSHDYNPDHYHLLNAQADEQERILSYVKQQREDAVAQLSKEQEQAALEALKPIEEKARPALLKDVPELQDPQKAHAALNDIVSYAVQNGIPQEVFTDPEQAKWVTSAQLHLAWKAAQYDKMKQAQAKVAPKAPKPTAPVVRPNAATNATGQKAVQRKNVMERLNRTGSIEDGAAAFKLFMG